MEDFRGSSSSDSGKPSCHRGHWRPAEDEKLRQLVDQYGPQNWNFIAEHLQGRSGKSCRLRWYNQLDPNINKRPFTEEEEERLLKAHHIQGNRWASIARLFPGRTDNAVKNHYHVVMARRKRERCLTVHGKRSNFQVQYPSDHHHRNSTTTDPGSNFGFFRPQGSPDYGSKLGFQNNIFERTGNNIPMSSSNSSPSWTNISASTITNDSLSFDVFDGKRKDYVHSISSSIYPKEGPLALNESLHSTNHPSSTIYGGNKYLNVVGKQIPNAKKVVPNNPFAFTSYGDGYGSNEEKMIKSQLVRLNSDHHHDSAALWKLPMASQKEQGDHGGQIKNQDVAFIDFLGVGIS